MTGSVATKLDVVRLSIAHVVDEGAWGGLATFMVNLLSSQRADPQFGDIHLICDPQNTDPALLEIAGVHHHAYRSDRRLAKAFETAHAVQAHLHDIRQDVVTLHSSFPGLWGRFPIHARPWKTVYCAHGWAFEQRVSPLMKWLYARVERWLSWYTDAIVSMAISGTGIL